MTVAAEAIEERGDWVVFLVNGVLVLEIEKKKFAGWELDKVLD